MEGSTEGKVSSAITVTDKEGVYRSCRLCYLGEYTTGQMIGKGNTVPQMDDDVHHLADKPRLSEMPAYVCVK